MKDQTRVIAALLIGAAAGAALGILLAPEKGETLRDGIADYINELLEATKNKAQATGSNIKEYGNNAVEKVKTKFSGMVNDVYDYEGDVVNSAKNEAKNIHDKAMHNFNGAKSKIKSTAADMNDAVQDM